MSDDVKEGPNLPPTARLPSEDIQRQLLDKLVSITTDIRSKVDDIDDRVGRVEANQEVGNASIRKLEERVTRAEGRQDAYEEWRLRNSERVKNMASDTSKVDLEHEAAIATIVTDVAAIKSDLATNTLVTTEVKKLLSSPMAKRVGQAAVTAAIAALTYLAAYFQMKGGH